MEIDGKLREDIVSPLLKISTYKGYTLTGPSEAIVRKVYSSQAVTVGDGTVQGVADSVFTQLSFRCLGTSPAAMLNARARLVVPLRFVGPRCRAADFTAGDTAQGWDSIPCGPRRNGLLKAFSSISTIINNTTSFSVRPDECLDVAEQCFSKEKGAGMTGVNNEAEQGWWGPDWQGAGQIGVAKVGANANGAGAVCFPIGDLARLAAIEINNTASQHNHAAATRLEEFRAGLRPVAGHARNGNAASRAVVLYDYKSDLFIPPFKSFDFPTISKSTSYIPYADQIEVACHWKAIGDIKSALLLGRGFGQGTNNVLQDFSLQYNGQPYLELEYIVPNFSIPPVVSLPAWRTIHYQHDVLFREQPEGQALQYGEGQDNKQTITMAPIRIESLPSAVFCWVSDVKLDGSAGPEYGWNMRQYFGKISNYSVTLNERLRVLSDRSLYDMYKLFRMYCPSSKMSFFTWSELRQINVFRSDILCTDASQSVFSPTTVTFKMDVERAIQNRSRPRSACTQRIHVLFWYGNEALSMSSQSSSVTSLLLNKSDVRTVKVGASASAITAIMAQNQ